MLQIYVPLTGRSREQGVEPTNTNESWLRWCFNPGKSSFKRWFVVQYTYLKTTFQKTIIESGRSLLPTDQISNVIHPSLLLSLYDLNRGSVNPLFILISGKIRYILYARQLVNFGNFLKEPERQRIFKTMVKFIVRKRRDADRKKLKRINRS